MKRVKEAVGHVQTMETTGDNADKQCVPACETQLQLFESGKSEKRTITKTRKEVVSYKSLKLKSEMSDTVSHVCNGSIRLAVKSLFTHANEEIRKQASNAVNDIIKKECSDYARKPSTVIRTRVDDISAFNVTTMITEFKKETPLISSLLQTAATNSKGKHDIVKVATAEAVLLNGRCVALNALQHVVGLSLYNSQLDKDGFAIMSKLGVSTSHSSVNRDLNKMKDRVTEEIKDLKKAVEENNSQDPSSDHPYTAKVRPETDDDHSYTQRPVEKCTTLSPGYRFNMDNLDFYLKVRNMTSEHQNQSLHYVQLMAIQDRVISEHLSDDHPLGDLALVPNGEFLPSAEDNYWLRDDLISVTAVLLAKHIKAFGIFSGLIPDGFVHEFSEEMKQKSKVIPLGILPLNENKMNDMIEILKHLQQYVPDSRSEDELQNEDVRDDTNAKMRPVAVGGDQLTCERIRGAHMSRLDGDTPEERLEGVFTMVEDFHEKMNFLQVIMDKYYSAASCREAGTLYQLKNLINRRNVVGQVSKDYHADAEFIDLVTDCHVLAAALHHFRMENLDSDCMHLPKGIHLADNDTQRRVFLRMVGQIFDHFFLNAISLSTNRLDDTDTQNDVQPERDGVFNYATNITKLGLFRKLAVKATRYGDGMRMLRHWKYAMLVYHMSHKVKYRLEGFLLLAGVKALFTLRQQHEVIHNRFINLKGGDGQNLDGDYVMELLNKYAKSRIRLLGPNHAPEVVDRVGKTRMICHDIQETLERGLDVTPVSRRHTAQSLDRDRMLLLNQLKEAEVFKFIPGRSHNSFAAESADIFAPINVQELHKWINEKKKSYSIGKLAF